MSDLWEWYPNFREDRSEPMVIELDGDHFEVLDYRNSNELNIAGDITARETFDLKHDFHDRFNDDDTEKPKRLLGEDEARARREAAEILWNGGAIGITATRLHHMKVTVYHISRNGKACAVATSVNEVTLFLIGYTLGQVQAKEEAVEVESDGDVNGQWGDLR